MGADLVNDCPSNKKMSKKKRIRRCQGRISQNLQTLISTQRMKREEKLEVKKDQ
jgi:hypothetical protein